MSSAGLVYFHFGEKIISDMLKNTRNLELTPSQLKSIFVKIYQSFIQEIDGIDNGVPQFEGEPLYRIKAELASQSVSAYGRAQPLQAGMQVEADILLDRRRLIEWIFEPLLSLAGRA